jgi:hypothetical protein
MCETGHMYAQSRQAKWLEGKGMGMSLACMTVFEQCGRYVRRHVSRFKGPKLAIRLLMGRHEIMIDKHLEGLLLVMHENTNGMIHTKCFPFCMGY